MITYNQSVIHAASHVIEVVSRVEGRNAELICKYKLMFVYMCVIRERPTEKSRQVSVVAIIIQGIGSIMLF